MSCSSDDDAPQDTIIGKWQLEQRFDDNIETTLSDCIKETTLEFKENNTLIDIESFVEQNNPCSSSTYPGTWEYNGDNALKFSYDYDETYIYNATYSFVNGELNFILADDIETIKTVWKRIN
jgi:hypothetical protein